tara:strand:- start:44 stop:292 length:249 start_codon:yes stop_codon:yes gene_type:complete
MWLEFDFVVIMVRRDVIRNSECGMERPMSGRHHFLIENNSKNCIRHETGRVLHGDSYCRLNANQQATEDDLDRIDDVHCGTI